MKKIIGRLVTEADATGTHQPLAGFHVAVRVPGSLFDYKGRPLAFFLTLADGRFELSVIPSTAPVRQLEIVAYDKAGRELPFTASDAAFPGYVLTDDRRARIEDHSQEPEHDYGQFVIREADAKGLKTTLGTGQALRYSEGNRVRTLMDRDAFTCAAAMMRFARQEVLLSQLFFGLPDKFDTSPFLEKQNLMFDFDETGPLELKRPFPRLPKDGDKRPERELLTTAGRGVDVRILLHAFSVPLFLRIAVGVLLFPYLVTKGISKVWKVLGDDLTDTDEVRRYFEAAAATNLTVLPFEQPVLSSGVMHAKLMMMDRDRMLSIGSPYGQSYVDRQDHAIDAWIRGSATGYPKHDAGFTMVGPAKADFLETMRLFWNDAAGSGNQLPAQMKDPVPPPPPETTILDEADDGTCAVQLVRTLTVQQFDGMPKGEKGILEAYLRGIASAKEFIYIETQYFTNDAIGDGLVNVLLSAELRVRVFPDKIHLDSHEPDLTVDEQTWGQHYWEQNWRAGDVEGDGAAAAGDAWRQLADRFGAGRAAWIARVLQPTNASERPHTPMPQGTALTPAPVFPAITLADSDEAWRHPPQARLLPDRWIAVVHAGGHAAVTVTGRDIKVPLAVGPDPRAPEPDPATKAAIDRGEQLAIDPGMKWMTDFDEAESAGMALRLTIPAATLTAGLDNLVVFGVRGSLSVAETADHLANLFDAHHYTDGLAFIRPGTPTNNTDDRRAGYSSDDPGHERSFGLEVAGTPTLDDNNALHTGTALGLRFDRILPTFARVERGLERDGRHMRSMNTALWQAGWGYFLSNMIGTEAGLTRSDIEWARKHFLDHVRCFGPLPAFRCGAQPYGLLPVTSLDLWQPGLDAQPQDTWLKGMLVALRDTVWRPAAVNVARIGNRRGTTPDPDADLVDVMRTDAISSRYRTRNVFGRHFLQHLQRFVGASVSDSDPAQITLLQQLGLSWRPRLSRMWNADWYRTLFSSLVQPGEVSPWTKLEPDFISALLSEPHIEQLIQARPDPQAPIGNASLLQMLLRHALLREIVYAAARLQSDETGADLAVLLRDVELVDLVTGAQPTDHWRRQLERTVTVAAGRTIREYLETQTTFTTPALAALGEFRSSLADLKDLDSEALLHLMQGTLDLSAHRLDAWVTSVATKRLAAMQVDGPNGQYLGAYGWVENLTPMPASFVKPVTTLPAGEPGPLQTPANDSGFIHAPSMTHAASAALLRNAHLGPSGVPSATSPFAIELSSRRVREASRLLDGVRQGQPLGALLGYRVERLLHDTVVDNGRTLDRFIAPLRRVAPLVARASAAPTAPVDTIAAENVVDGLVLHRRWKDERSVVMAEISAAAPSTSDLSAISSILDRLDDMIDGLSDALTAETAYQMVRGNTSRTASTLAAIAQGNAPPPELDVTKTPRSGTSLTHRLLLLMSGPNVNTPGWISAASRVRSNAEPMLNFWAFKLLGDGSRIRCTIERLDDVTGAVVETRKLPLSELGLAPLDVVYGVEAANTTAQPGMTLSGIEQQVLYHAKRRTGGFDPLATLRLRHARPADLAVGEITLFDALEQGRAVRRLLGVARGADPEDLNPPERTGQGVIDLVELDARVVRAENALNAAHAGLKNLIARITTTTTAEMLRTALLKLGAFGMEPAVPVSVAGEDATAKAALVQQGQALLKLSGPRLDQGALLRAEPVAADQRGRRAQLTARMRAVFGDTFAVLPRFTFDAAAATEFASAVGASTAAQGGDPLAVHTWFARCSRVRDGVSRFGACLQRADVLNTGARLNLSVAQLPFQNGERWVGLAPAAGAVIPPSKLSLVMHTIGPINPTLFTTGLLVDEWVEVVPNARETTALAFQFDMPDTCAPQSVLIAVPPVPGQDWSAETLRRVLMETLDLAKLRAVDSSSLGAAAQHLPGLYFAFNTEDHAVSTDFIAVSR